MLAQFLNTTSPMASILTASHLRVSQDLLPSPQKKSGKSLEEYIETVDVNGGRRPGYISMNQMMWDLGLPFGQFDNLTQIDHIVSILIMCKSFRLCIFHFTWKSNERFKKMCDLWPFVDTCYYIANKDIFVTLVRISLLAIRYI